RENIEYESLCEQHKHHVQEIDEIVDLMLEVACSNKKTIRKEVMINQRRQSYNISLFWLVYTVYVRVGKPTIGLI
ncbi:MAG: DUF6017 domain-containing protein, partial [Defluviitaleaceae bacterium]|nr:DUF6017 domain-containing protein [Defluviitaleaceae bacterium]